MSSRLNKSLDEIADEDRKQRSQARNRNNSRGYRNSDRRDDRRGDQRNNRGRGRGRGRGGSGGRGRGRGSAMRRGNFGNRRGGFNGPYSTEFVGEFSPIGTSDRLEKWDHSGYEELMKNERSNPRRRNDDDNDYAYKVRIASLHYDVLDEDLEELLGTITGFVSSKVDFDNAGRSNGTAEAIFDSRDSADKAIEEFDGRTIDGHPLVMTLGGRMLKPKKKKERGTQRRGDDIKLKKNGMRMDSIPDLKINVSF